MDSKGRIKNTLKMKVLLYLTCFAVTDFLTITVIPNIVPVLFHEVVSISLVSIRVWYIRENTVVCRVFLDENGRE